MTQDAKVNGIILNALEKRGLLTGCDNQHKEGVDPNSWRNKSEDWYYVGRRIKTELIED